MIQQIISDDPIKITQIILNCAEILVAIAGALYLWEKFRWGRKVHEWQCEKKRRREDREFEEK